MKRNKKIKTYFWDSRTKSWKTEKEADFYFKVKEKTVDDSLKKNKRTR